ncbi:MAG TPA: hypothetical protein VJ279_10920 [Hanamia sp.]|jgi:hypothetical protein|nr:hypothetical protein [Hanamia sp.]
MAYTNENNEVPDEIREIASAARENLLPTKSRHIYEDTYRTYQKWCSEKKIGKTTEDSILAFFHHVLSSYKSSSLWTKFSMLRTTIKLNDGIDIGTYPSVIAFLKRKGEGFKAKKSLSLTRENVNNFLLLADDKEHLLNKVKIVIPFLF